MFKNFTIGLALLAISADAQRRPRGRLQTMGGIAEIEDEFGVEDSRAFVYLYQRKDRDGDLRPARLEGYALGLEPGVKYTISIQDNPGNGSQVEYQEDRQVLEFPVLSEQEDENNSGEEEDDDEDDEGSEEDSDNEMDSEEGSDFDTEEEEDSDEEGSDNDMDSDQGSDFDEEDEEDSDFFSDFDSDEEDDEDEDFDEDDEEEDEREGRFLQDDSMEEEDDEEDDFSEEGSDNDMDSEEEESDFDSDEDEDSGSDEDDDEDEESGSEDDEEDDDEEMEEAIQELATLDDQFNLWEDNGETLEGKLVVLAREGVVVGYGEVTMLEEGYRITDVQEMVECWNFPELC